MFNIFNKYFIYLNIKVKVNSIREKWLKDLNWVYKRGYLNIY